MQCSKCKNEIPDGSIYCNWCGAKQIKERGTKKEITVPKARQLSSGKWFIQMRLGGQSISVTEDTEALCTTKARAIKAGFLDDKKSSKSLTLSEAIDQYITARDAVLSPSTIRGYRTIQRTRFLEQMPRPLDVSRNWQSIVNAEARRCSAKTLANTWGFLCSVFREQGIASPKVTLPQIAKKELPWLDYDQILVFLDAIQGSNCELAALLALHSLRRSEIYALTARKIDLDKNIILLSGSVVLDENNQFVEKEANKNEASQRIVPIMIPRLRQLLIETLENMQPDDPVLTVHPNSIYSQINKTCKNVLLPQVGYHGLRRSFASLGHHLGIPELEVMAMGGWADYHVMHKHYLKLAAADRANAENRMTDFYKNANKNANDL